MLGSRYKPVNIRAEKSPDPTTWWAQIDLEARTGEAWEKRELFDCPVSVYLGSPIW